MDVQDIQIYVCIHIYIHTYIYIYPRRGFSCYLLIHLLLICIFAHLKRTARRCSLDRMPARAPRLRRASMRNTVTKKYLGMLAP